MLIKRSQIPFVLAIAILGPILGGIIALNFLEGPACPVEPDSSLATSAVIESAEPTPDVTLENGGQMEIDELAPGKPKAVVVMKGAWCTVCRKQLSAVSEHIREIWRADAAVFGLSDASAEKNRQLRAALDIEFPVLSDADGDLLKKVGLWRGSGCSVVPGVVFLSEDGQVEEVVKGRYPGKSQTDMIITRLGAK
jgi:peroxiredoxin